MTLVDPGSVNMGLTSAGTVPDAATAGPYQNSYADLEYMFARSGELGAAPSISVFEPGFLRTTLTLHRAGRVPPGAMVKLYFGGELEFGLPPTATALDAYLELLEPSGLPWSVAVLGGDVVGCGLAERAIRRGGHVRVGLEDYAGPAVPTNLELLDERGRAGRAARAGPGHHRGGSEDDRSTRQRSARHPSVKRISAAPRWMSRSGRVFRRGPAGSG